MQWSIPMKLCRVTNGYPTTYVQREDVGQIVRTDENLSIGDILSDG